MSDQLLPLPLTERSVHLCVDMQRIFSAEGPWPTPWMEKVLPVAVSLAAVIPRERFFPGSFPPSVLSRCRACGSATTRAGASRPESPRSRAAGINAAAREVLPARDHHRQNTLFGFRRTRAHRHLRQRQADALIVSGSETDVCVLATVLDAVDIGYRVIVVRDAICSSSDQGHEMLMRLYHTRYTEQIETANAETILARWD